MAKSPGKGGGKSGGKAGGKAFSGSCNYCKKTGHKAADCLKKKSEEKKKSGGGVQEVSLKVESGDDFFVCL